MPTVSTPLEWKEINQNLDPHSFTIHNILKRVEKKGDLFSGLFDKKCTLANNKALAKF